MINVEDVPSAERKLRTERVNETRHVRSFTREELEKLLLKAVLDEALISEWSSKREASTIHVLPAPGLPEAVTVKVTVPEVGF